jgi:menaquinone-dependent protoporphyrinogen oxidase
MADVLVCYGTGEGQTARVADRLATTLRDRGHEPTVVDLGAGPPDRSVEAFDAVLVGASLHYGRHQRAVGAFVRDEREALAARPTGFFQLSLSTASDDPETRAAAAGVVDEFVEQTGWQPDRVGLFGGALRYSQYGFLTRLAMKRIARKEGGATDTSRDHEYTDWAEVAAFARDFAAFVEGRLGVTPPTSDETPSETDADR